MVTVAVGAVPKRNFYLFTRLRLGNIMHEFHALLNVLVRGLLD